MVEEKIVDLYPSDLIQSPVHLSIGQEAVAVGVCQHLSENDLVFINYRGHAFYLAKGGLLPQFFAELMGRVDGISKGKAGSMHLASPDHGIMGSSAVVASTISHAVGAALAAKVNRQSQRVFVAVFGDGAMEQGVFYESLNFAALHSLPVLFLCEDNCLAVHTHTHERQSFDVQNLVSSFGISYSSLEEGYDPELVSAISEGVINQIRKDQRPAFLRIRTLRYKEHVGPGDDFHIGYREEGEFIAWKLKDPLNAHSSILTDYRSIIAREIDEAVSFALNSPVPTVSDLLSDVI